MPFTDLFQGVLEEFAERQGHWWRSDAEVGGMHLVHLSNVADETRSKTEQMADWRRRNPAAAKQAEQRKYAAIKADEGRLARRREVARLSAARRRKARLQ